MSDAPDRVWLTHFGNEWGDSGEWLREFDGDGAEHEYAPIAELEALRAENARLRAVLQGMVDLAGTMGSNLYAQTVDRAARAALNEKPPTPNDAGGQ